MATVGFHDPQGTALVTYRTLGDYPATGLARPTNLVDLPQSLVGATK